MPLLCFGGRFVPSCSGAASSWRLPLRPPPGIAGSVGGGRGARAAPRCQWGTRAMPTCSVVPRSLHLREAVGHGQLQVLILILAVRVEADGRGVWGPVRGRWRGRGRLWAGKDLLLPPAQLQPQCHVIGDAWRDRGRGQSSRPLQLSTAGTGPHHLLPTPPILHGRASGQGQPQLSPKPSLAAASPSHPRAEEFPRGEGSGRRCCQTPTSLSVVPFLTIDVDRLQLPVLLHLHPLPPILDNPADRQIEGWMVKGQEAKASQWQAARSKACC